MKRYDPSELEEMANLLLVESGDEDLVRMGYEIDKEHAVIGSCNFRDSGRCLELRTDTGYAMIYYSREEDDSYKINIAESEPKRQGFFSILLEELEERASREGISSIFLEVFSENQEARKAYSARGFREVGEVGESNIVMRKDLC